MADELTLHHKRVAFTAAPIMYTTKEESKKEVKNVSGNLQ